MKCHYTFDATQLACPLPLAKTKQKIKEMGAGETLLVITKDRSSVLDFNVYTKISGHTLLKTKEENGNYYFYIKK